MDNFNGTVRQWNFMFLAWIPTLYIRVHDWEVSSIGYAFGTILLIFGPLGIALGARLGDYFVGTTLNFTALPANGWVFDHWEVDNNVFTPDQFAELILLGITDSLGDIITWPLEYNMTIPIHIARPK